MMGKIIILDENTVNKIAAGEVAERPASVVKELVENSIDAGSSVINVEIRNGGISFIRVLDNGSGLSADDVEMAFERHATSKIRKADDLESITSMGFRGEALASIAAVSEVQMLTRTRDSVQGTCIKVRGGAVTDVQPAGCPVGTSITVRELFFNTPARYKFLKKDTTEAGYVIDMLSRIALSHPDISFTLVNNGKKVLHTPGNGDLKSTVFSIYGAETAKQLHQVDYTDGGIKIEGFVGKAETARSNRAHQSIYINKRYIRNKTITSAIDSAYTTFLMKNRYPFVLLNITINPSSVDVNVHPSKMEVKFSNDQEIFRAVYHAVNNALLSRSAVRTLPGLYESQAEETYLREQGRETDLYGKGSKTARSYLFNDKPSAITAYTQQEFEWVRKELEVKREAAISGKNLSGDMSDRTAEPGPTPEKTQPGSSEQSGTGTDIMGHQLINETDNMPLSGDEEKPDCSGHSDDPGQSGDTVLICENGPVQSGDTVRISPVPTSDPDRLSPVNLSNPVKKDADKTAVPVRIDSDKAGDQAGSDEQGRHENTGNDRSNGGLGNLFANVKIIGQLFSTYILLEGENEVFLLDQHAAHERVRYERLRKSYSKNEPFSQMLMSVIHVDLTSSEYEFAMSERPFFEKLGFSFESFGSNSVILRSAPLIDDLDIKGCFLEILDFVMSGGNGEKSLIADEALYRMACRSAVKAHKKLDDKEIKALMDELSSMDNPFTCPHGRPVIFRLRRYDLEKLFKRIV